VPGLRQQAGGAEPPQIGPGPFARPGGATSLPVPGVSAPVPRLARAAAAGI